MSVRCGERKTRAFFVVGLILTGANAWVMGYRFMHPVTPAVLQPPMALCTTGVGEPSEGAYERRRRVMTLIAQAYTSRTPIRQAGDWVFQKPSKDPQPPLYVTGIESLLVRYTNLDMDSLSRQDEAALSELNRFFAPQRTQEILEQPLLPNPEAETQLASLLEDIGKAHPYAWMAPEVIANVFSVRKAWGEVLAGSDAE